MEKKEMTLEEVQAMEAKTETKYAEAMDTIIEDKRIVGFNGKVCFLKTLGVNEENICRKFFAKRYGEMLKENILMSRKRLAKMLKDSGDWTDADEADLKTKAQAFQDLFKEMTSYPADMKINPDNSVSQDFQVLCEKSEAAMKEYTAKMMECESVFAPSLEMVLEKEMELVKLSLSLVDAEGKPIFSHYDKLSEYDNATEVRSVLRVAINFWRGVEERFLEGSLAIPNGGADTKPAKTETLS